MKKKFWKSIKLKEINFKFGIFLDDKILKTPQKNDCIFFSKKIANLLIKEWSYIDHEININNMPITQICFASLDREKKEQNILYRKLLDYGMTDLLFYRADFGTELAKLQSKKWDKILDLAKNEFNLNFKVVNGLMPVEQPKKNYGIFLQELKKLDCFSLTVISDVVTTTGSLIIGLLLLRKKMLPKQAWLISRVDEDWQREEWGTISDHLEVDEYKKKKFLISCKIINNLN